jgi:hypothetical protein
MRSCNHLTLPTRPLFSIAILPFARPYCILTTVAILQTGSRHSLRARLLRFPAFSGTVNTRDYPIATV